MANKSNNRSEGVSALDTVLKHLLNLFRRICHFLGVILIDRGMRSIVSWYDKTHDVKSCNNSRDNRGDDSGQNRQINELIEENSFLRSAVNKEKERFENLRSNIDSTNAELSDCKARYQSLESSYRELERNNNELTKQNSKLVSRCLPENEIPAMVYYAQGDAAGLTLRKISTTLDNDHLYCLTTTPGDVNTAEFQPIINQNIQFIISNRNVTLLACEILGISAQPKSLKVIAPGRAILKDNKWIVINKAKIELI